MTTTEMIKEWLVKNNYSGLYNPNTYKPGKYMCCCDIQDLCECGADSNGIYGCLPGYRRSVRIGDLGRDYYGYTIDPQRQDVNG